MQEFVVGIPSIWISLTRRVARVVLLYIEVVEATTTKEVEEASDVDDQGD